MTRPHGPSRPHAHGAPGTVCLFAECQDGRCWACPSPLVIPSSRKTVAVCSHSCHDQDTTPHVSTAAPTHPPRAGAATTQS